MAQAATPEQTVGANALAGFMSRPASCCLTRRRPVVRTRKNPLSLGPKRVIEVHTRPRFSWYLSCAPQAESNRRCVLSTAFQQQDQAHCSQNQHPAQKITERVSPLSTDSGRPPWGGHPLPPLTHPKGAPAVPCSQGRGSAGAGMPGPAARAEESVLTIVGGESGGHGAPPPTHGGPSPGGPHRHRQWNRHRQQHLTSQPGPPGQPAHTAAAPGGAKVPKPSWQCTLVPASTTWSSRSPGWPRNCVRRVRI